MVNLDDIDRLTLGASFDQPDQWGPVVQEAITNAQLPGVLAAVEAGQRVAFGSLSIDRHAITIDKTTIPWRDLQSASLNDGVVVFKASGRLLKTREPIYMIPNFFVFKAAVQARSGLAWT